MKTRNGFVSNSSSSSFIVAVKDGKTDPREILKKLSESVNKDNLFSFLEKKAFQVLSDGLGYGEQYTSVEQLRIDKYCDDEEELENSYSSELELLKKYGTVYEGSLCTDEGGLESELCYNEFEFENDDIIIINKGY